MGLQGVELVMEVEEHFGIVIGDSEAEKVRTVRDLVQLVQHKTQNFGRQSCVTLPCFLALRHLVRDTTGNPQLRIRPRQSLVHVLRARERRRLWRRLPELLDRTPPRLLYPQSIAWVFIVSIMAVAAASLWFASLDWRILPLSVVGTISIVSLLSMATNPLRIVPPSDYRTFGQIAIRMAARQVSTKQRANNDDESLLSELRPLIANCLGVDVDEVVPNARLIEDLGMD